jgi:GNAT superfamily N-acetyltransferase
MKLRETPRNRDREAVLHLVRLTGFFSEEEEGIAVELVDEALARGRDSGYEFIFADHPEHPDRLLGYTCYGPIPGTVSSYDLYWIAVDPGEQGKGIGARLLAESEKAAIARGATRLYADTSGKAGYEPTRAFYKRMGYQAEAVLKDYFGYGDDKVIFSKVLT